MFQRGARMMIRYLALSAWGVLHTLCESLPALHAVTFLKAS